ncbi:putative phage tail protein [Sporosarcina sp. UB5]|uniref:putative phage tail protein n=1 Tax=Sporosarcina sp. UB5 TaxID=3047463 RepID=UPI003D794698
MPRFNVPATDAIETRRFRLLSRHQEQAPYTNKVLRQLLDGLLGTGNYEFKRNTAEKWITVKLELTVKGQFETVEFTLERITPQNMVLQWNYVTTKIRC